jgi:deoxycytidylate deaminase
MPKEFLGDSFSDSEIVIGLVGAVGTELNKIVEILEERLQSYGYKTLEIRVSRDIIPLLEEIQLDESDEITRISRLMTAGDNAREKSGDNSVLALGVAARIAANRGKNGEIESLKHRTRHAYLVNSLKHPHEAARLREIYEEGFYLIGVFSDEKQRRQHLADDERLALDETDALMQRDADEHVEHGQRTSDTFHRSDFFAHLDGNPEKLKNGLWRILDIIFGHPHKTPTFDEYAMFMAFSAALRSADLSRQVGAVVARNDEIVATGANDCPKCGGGLYWPEYNETTQQVEDAPNGRDYKRGSDSNKIEKEKIIEDIVQKMTFAGINGKEARAVLKQSRIGDITEYGRVVHAEMEALLSCSRNNISAKDATLYCTTFPCHNCAKHIIAAGITRVVYIEPYPKSKALEFHDDAISASKKPGHVHFEPFMGVGPRRFFDLFSMDLSSGYAIKRKRKDGRVLDWRPEEARLRMQMLPYSYLDKEVNASDRFYQYKQEDKS